MADDKAGFRAVLHEWARGHLERYGHIGPFEISAVDVAYVRGNGSPDTPADDEVWVRIRFRHPGGCTAWSRPGWPCQPENSWSMPETTTTVELLNELLAIADEQ